MLETPASATDRGTLQAGSENIKDAQKMIIIIPTHFCAFIQRTQYFKHNYKLSFGLEFL